MDLHPPVYLQLCLSLPESSKDAAMALLAEAGFEAFEDSAQGLDAYILKDQYDPQLLDQYLAMLNPPPKGRELQEIPYRNWNAEWEANFEAIHIDQFCQVIASFKAPDPEFTYTIVIDPKMAFGTGHHETTRLVIRQMSQMEVAGKKVLDMGCGTGILAILAAKMGAKDVLGIDIDPLSYDNARENAALNDQPGLTFMVGTASTIPEQVFDMVLANINRNVLIQDVATYSSRLRNGGILVASGFYQEDKPMILAAFSDAGLEPKDEFCENNWLSISFIKNLSQD